MKSDNYEDIIHLSRPVSRHPRMARKDRGAQFAPFAALTGHDQAIDETARRTETFVELTEGQQEVINERLQKIWQCLPEHPEVVAVYFVPDEKKQGGRYIRHRGYIKKFDLYSKNILWEDGTKIPIRFLYDIDFAPQ